MKFICLIVKASLLIAYLHANISYLSVRNKLNKSKSVLSSSNLTSKILYTRTCVSTCMYRDANCSIQLKKNWAFLQSCRKKWMGYNISAGFILYPKLPLILRIIHRVLNCWNSSFIAPKYPGKIIWTFFFSIICTWIPKYRMCT